MHTLLVNSNVKVDDISVLERTTVGYAMADDFIDGGTQWFGEFVVIIRGRVGIVLDNKVVHCFVYLVCSCAHLDLTMSHVQSLPCYYCHSPQFFNVFVTLHLHYLLKLRLLLLFWHWSKEVVRLDNVLWNVPLLWYGSRAKGARPLKALILFLGLLFARNMY